MTFPALFPFSFPGGTFTPLPGSETIEGTALEWIPDHGELAVSLLLDEFRRKARLVTLIRALSAGIQELDDASWQLLTERSLDSSVGAQLDLIGKLVGLARAGWGDETYRALLKAQIRVLRSDATWPALLAILELLGVDLALVAIAEPGMAAMLIVLGAPIDPNIAPEDLFGLLLVPAKAAGVRLVLEYPVATVTETFTWADGDVAQADAMRGWADDAATLGGYWSGDLGTTETT